MYNVHTYYDTLYIDIHVTCVCVFACVVITVCLCVWEGGREG